ncbi:MAG: MarR family winged helix-turn-helix transcriptional regulator, partial [Streptosporangiaceae bacterium]
TYIYAEESDLAYGLFRHVRYQAQTRLWGYDLHNAGHQQELTTMSVDGAAMPATQAPPVALSPLGSARAWERQAEDNVLDRLERAGYLRRVREEANRRQVLLQLTAKFADETEEIFAPVAAEGAAQLGELSDPEIETLIEFFSHAHEQRVKHARLIREQTAMLAATYEEMP